MNVRPRSFGDARDAAQACASYVADLLNEALSEDRPATLAVSGGSTPKLLFEALVNLRLDWKGVHLFWVDERPVPPSDPQSNYRLAEESLILPAGIPKSNSHRILGELEPEEAAVRYVEEIREFFRLAAGEYPHFDIVQLGMGADAHTASLFPGEPLLSDRGRIAEAVYVAKLGQFRITLMPAALLSARHTVFLVAGAGKADAVRAVFDEPYEPLQLPAQLPAHHAHSVSWFLDDAAAALIV